MYNNDEFLGKILDKDAEVKDIEWAKKMVTNIMFNAKSVISKKDYERKKNILTGQFPSVNFDRIFTGEHMAKIKEKLSQNNSLYFFERIVNTLIDQRNEAGLSITINSLDPQKQEKKKYDRDLLVNRKGIENAVNSVTANNGMPPVKIQAEDYHGNTSEFDAQSGDEFDSTEVDAFFARSWGLLDEINYGNAINNIMTENNVRGEYDKYIKDIMICLHNFSQAYVDAVEGGVKIKHLYPYEPKVLHATGSNNYKNVQGWQVPQQTNVRGFMREFGSHFDLDKDWSHLLAAATGSTYGKPTYSGLTEGGTINRNTGLKEGGILVYGSTGKVMDFEQFLDLPISYSYTEWITVNRTVTQYGVTKEGNIIPSIVSRTNPRIDGCETDEVEAECTYYAYSLDVNSVTPKIIKWGKVYMQEFEGLSDEYSGFTIKGNKRDGVPICDVLEPFWHIINVTFKMLEMLIYDIKPDGVAIDYESAIRIAAELVKSTDAPTDIKKGLDLYLQQIQDSPNIITHRPQTPAGDQVGGGISSVTKNKKGLNETAIDVMKVIDWAEAKASLYTGTQGIEIPNPDDGFKLSLESKIRTRASTSFIDFILLEHLKDISITCLNYVQDISHFPDIPAYKYLECAIGYKAIEYIGKKEKSPHRYGTFVQTFNNDIKLMEIRGRAAQALDKGLISFEQWLVLLDIDNPVQAAMYLSYERKKADKQKQLEARAALAGQDALAQKAHERAIELENLKGKWRTSGEDKRAAGFIEAAHINTSGGITKQQMQNDGQDGRLAAQAQNDLDKIAATATQNAQQPPN